MLITGGGVRGGVRPRILANVIAVEITCIRGLTPILRGLTPIVLIELASLLGVVVRPPCLPAVELTVSESRQATQTEKIGFVDMERIFEEFPGTKRAQAELNQLIFGKRQMLKTKAQEVAMLKTAIEALETELKQQKPLPSTGTVGGLTQSTTTIRTGTVGPAISTGIAGARPLLSTATVIPSQVTASTGIPAFEVGSSTIATQRSGVPSTGTARLIPLTKEEELTAKRQELVKQDAALQTLQRNFELEIRRMEEEKSLAVMARIYRALEEVAQEESVTLIVDKQQILYSQSALDLTEAVRERLRGK